MIQQEYCTVAIDINGKHQTKASTKSPYIEKQKPSQLVRPWRWWNYIWLAIILLTIVESVLFIVSWTLLESAQDPIKFDIHVFPKIPYRELDMSTPLKIPRRTTVYHVTKEFGIATMGGMGTALTAIAQAQLQSGRVKPSVVMPYYSFLKRQEQYPIKTAAELVTTYKNDKGQTLPVEFKVYQMIYDFNPISNFESLPKSAKAELMSKSLRANKTMRVYLIGPGKVYPLLKSFHANSVTQLYSTLQVLPQEWQDQYFNKAVASFLISRATAKHEQSLFAPLYVAPPRVDIVHLHGATNAYVAKYMQEFANEKFTITPPAVIYTMHDYLDELQYTNRLDNFDKFWTSSQRNMKEILQGYTYNSQRVFLSPLAIDAADAITFVSKKMAKDMVEGNIDFYLKEVVMNSILRKAEKGQFYGISHGVALGANTNPYRNTQLVQNGLNFTTKLARSETKRLAKEFLIAHNQLRPEDLERPLVLYVGRFQYNKGLETFSKAVGLFRKYNIKFAILGQPNNYPLEWVENLAEENLDHVVLMSTVRQQERWLSYFRAAADFVYVPSVTESFGLVAVEGLAFGSAVISTGAGGLSEFLIDRKESMNFNAYLFDAQRQGSLAQAVKMASDDYQQLITSPMDHESFVVRMIQSAQELSWDKGNEEGPVYDYLRVYEKAMKEKRLKNRQGLKEVS
ncbi:unnamed protein product [Rhizopus stolonifer]